MYNIIEKDMVDTAIQHISQVYDNNKQVNLCTISLIKTWLIRLDSIFHRPMTTTNR